MTGEVLDGTVQIGGDSEGDFAGILEVLVLVHTKDSQAAGFYRHYGFEPSPVDDLTLMLLIKDIQP